MTLTVVSTYFPVPADRGDPVRVLMMLRALADAGDYTLFVVRRPDTTAIHLDELRKLLPGIEIRDFDPTPYRFDRLGPLGRYPQARSGGLPPWIRSRYSRELHDELRTRSGPAIGIGEAAGAYFPGTSLRWHWDKANVLAASTRLDIADTTGRARLRARYLADVSTRFEAAAVSMASTISVTSVEESARLADALHRSADFVAPSCVSVPVDHVPRPVAGRLIWLGTFAYPPNLRGLLRFLDEGWSALRTRGYTLSLVGSGLTARVHKRLTRYDGVAVAGYVEDLGSALAPARAAVVPLWSGAGVKLKTLTLLAHSVPVFATVAGAEGVTPDEAVRVADTPAGLADQILRSSADDFDRMAVQARNLVQREHSVAHFAEGLVGALTRHGYLDDPVNPEGR